jgi:hypothetical protein
MHAPRGTSVGVEILTLQDPASALGNSAVFRKKPAAVSDLLLHSVNIQHAQRERGCDQLLSRERRFLDAFIAMAAGSGQHVNQFVCHNPADRTTYQSITAGIVIRRRRNLRPDRNPLCQRA